MERLQKPSKELLQDFKTHYVWRYLEQKINLKQEDCKDRLLNAKSIEEVQKIQTQFDTYKTILNLVKEPE